ncbi:MAG: D-glycero-beta-D-manno-heptose-7-phosphate kinase [Bacteroidetes bacterium]|nr:MAG: D-glycero-beta-D-manno-heptose-7-phosphate kinase [Bacteroidota bacterium]
MLIDFDSIFDNFSRLRVLIIGDVMIDSYLWGDVTRISPEAPVPIVQVKQRDKRLGGAANVALNVQALGATPILCATVGKDSDGQDFLDILAKNNLSADGICLSDSRVTTIKHRILSGHQHLLRVDSEQTNLLSPADSAELWLRIEAILPTVHVVIFEDYDKGVLSEELIQKTIALAQKLDIPTIVDPKLRNFWHYKGATVFKPNLKELKEGLKTDFNPKNLDELKQAITTLKERLSLKQALVTLSERGVYIDAEQESHLIPAHVRAIADVSGAGDTVVSVASLALALGLKPALMAGLANLAGGLVCEHVGVVPIVREELLAEAKANIVL